MNTRLKTCYVIAATAAVLLTSRLSATDATAGQDVGITVPEVNLLAVTNPPTLTVSAPSAGAVVGYNGGVGASDGATAKMKFTTNDPVAGGKKITASIGSDITNASLKVEITTSTTGLGYTAIAALSTTPQPLFDGFSYIATDNINATGLQLKYTFLIPNTASGAQFVASSVSTVTVTYTLTDHT